MKFKAPWGEVYGGSAQFHDSRGRVVWMCRRGQKVRFYRSSGRQVGPEQSNVAPAIAWALKQGWRDSTVGVTDASYLDALGSESARRYAPVIRAQAAESGVPLPLGGDDLSVLLRQTIKGLHQEGKVDWNRTPDTRKQVFTEAWAAEMRRQGIM